ncbi:MAG TPA: hypothetical protein DCP92_22475 [Nitrospiraceae bacterium]|jgi:hypothetical protein|nr:hypothetical protein [Nitrospiraceae bacterium]
MSLTLITLLGLVLGPLAAHSGEHQMGAVTHSKDFERMKELAGVWEGKADMGKGMETIKATYELTSAGNAIVERLFVGQPHEMVTVYYDFNGKLVMTHYCSLGNQPHMELMNPGDKDMTFILSEKSPNLSSVRETHMHALKFSFDNKDSFSQTWTLYEKGEKKSDVLIKLARSKS